MSEKIFYSVAKSTYKQQANVCKGTIKGVNIIDASTVTKTLNGMEWAKFRENKSGIKLHLGIKYHSKDLIQLQKAIITEAKHADVNYLTE